MDLGRPKSRGMFRILIFYEERENEGKQLTWDQARHCLNHSYFCRDPPLVWIPLCADLCLDLSTSPQQQAVARVMAEHF